VRQQDRRVLHTHSEDTKVYDLYTDEYNVSTDSWDLGVYSGSKDNG
jgi:hypothetical protein